MAVWGARRISTEEDIFDPSEIVSLPIGSSINDLDELRNQSLPELDAVIDEIERSTGLPSERNQKSHRAAELKVERPEVLEGKPWMTLVHLRDYLRFRTGLANLADFDSVMNVFERLQEASEIRIVRIDLAKLLVPREFGWRMIAVDIQLRTGMLVEHYMTFDALIRVNEDWLHKVYERWRGAQAATIGEARKRKRDAVMSSAAYRELFAQAVCDTRMDNTSLWEGKEAAFGRIDDYVSGTLKL
jgi:hypothetical protein